MQAKYALDKLRLAKFPASAFKMIRQAQLSDYDKIKNLIVSEGLTTSDFFTRNRFERALQAFGRYYLVEERDGKVVGTISGFDDGGIFYGWMMRLAVDRNHRKRHIGEGLVKAGLEEFRKAGVPVVYAGAHRLNESSKNLLTKLGFAQEGFELVYREF